MNNVADRFLPQTLEDITTVKKRLKECKEEWLETKPGRGQKYIGHNTARQILDNAVKDITYWDFGIIKQWKEEVNAYNKNQNQWYFDGYVYHVQGYMYIPGIGRREQFGSKVAIGGKDNQDSAYKAATSNCFTKCASMFGVGEDIYSKIKVQDEQEVQQAAYQQQQQWGQQAQQQQNYNQQQNYQQNYQQQPQQWNQQTQQQMQQQPMQETQQVQQQQGFNQNQQWGANPNFHNGQQQYNQQQESPAVGPINQNDLLAVDRSVYNNQVEVPFENVQQQQYQAEAKPEAEQSQYQAIEQQPAKEVSYGAPVDVEKTEKTENKPSGEAPTTGTNPWQEQGVIVELQKYAQHKARLNAEDDEKMIPYLRDYFKDESATFSTITPENLPAFNVYLENISV
ncbi:hypothetical protein [Oceanobacillus profundus]|uniref:hypothetical protein n=1 Tax=Oceanobacillus profundus TaxID=372463 RepID=UPI001651DAB2|nr:hypothetical protein [Oceanobacillus profundus]MBR3121336.1 hypothetical protein [Oceanobacillus sp.]